LKSEDSTPTWRVCTTASSLRTTNPLVTFARWAGPIVILAISLAGCASVHHMMPGNKDTQQTARRLRELQLRVMAFADEYTGRVIETVSRFQRVADSPEERLVAQNWKVSQAASAYTIASGPNPITNVVDMVVLATLSRLVLEDVWVSDLYHDRARSVLETQQALERESWELLHGVINDAQAAQLREVITRWRSAHPNVRAVTYVHFADFLKSVSAPSTGEATAQGSLFSLIGIDPFSSLDPAVLEIAQTRQLAERGIYYAQRVPNLLDMQVERLTYQVASMPETKTLLADVDRASLVGSAADQLTRSLPGIIAKERQALIAQVLQELDARRTNVSALTGELRSTLQAGTETANALQATLEALDRVSARFSDKPAAPKRDEKGRPFDIREYTEMLRELTVTVRELNTLSQHMDTAIPAVRGATEDATNRLDHLANRLFVKLALLILILVVVTLIARLAYRFIIFRMERRDSSVSRAQPT
jgi:hypothetical protein